MEMFTDQLSNRLWKLFFKKMLSLQSQTHYFRPRLIFLLRQLATVRSVFRTFLSTSMALMSTSAQRQVHEDVGFRSLCPIAAVYQLRFLFMEKRLMFEESRVA